MKKVAILFGAVALFSLSSCNKCHECHYELNGTEVELGEFCGDDLTDIEATGFVDDAGNTHEVHCGEEH